MFSEKEHKMREDWGKILARAGGQFKDDLTLREILGCHAHKIDWQGIYCSQN